MYFTGKGCGQDLEKSFELFQKAAEQGDTDSQYQVAEFYYYEAGLKDSSRKKKMQQFCETKRNEWGFVLYDSLIDDYNCDDICLENNKTWKQNMALAIEWYVKAADSDNADAQFMLGKIYYTGNGCEQDFKRALELLKKASNHNNERASLLLGLLYFEGKEIEKDFNKSYDYFSKIEDNEFAQLYLGHLFYDGLGVKQDFAKAKEWYEKAASQGNIEAGNKLGLMYEKGLGTEQDFLKAFECYKKNCIQYGSPKARGEAEFHLAEMYYYGRGIEQDYDWALGCYNRAAEQGYSAAVSALEKLKNKMQKE
ncbi:hypothetical protein MSI_26720 [Treponema sp. JC4]|nr:hypothetical protein MSI_26720 [Treponema sp. JC4]